MSSAVYVMCHKTVKKDTPFLTLSNHFKGFALFEWITPNNTFTQQKPWKKSVWKPFSCAKLALLTEKPMSYTIHLNSLLRFYLYNICPQISTFFHTAASIPSCPSALHIHVSISSTTTSLSAASTLHRCAWVVLGDFPVQTKLSSPSVSLWIHPLCLSLYPTLLLSSPRQWACCV